MLDKNNKIIKEQNVVYKDIKRNYDVFHVPIVQEQLRLRGIKCPKIENFTIRGLNDISYSYLYVNGVDRTRIDDGEYIQIVNDISKFIEDCNIQSLCNVTVYDKIDVFLDNLSIDEANALEKQMILSLEKMYGDIKKKYRCTHLIHGDLDYSNIIWNDEGYTIIDFDECCLAPKGMECAIALARLIKKKVSNNENVHIEIARLLEKYEIDVNLIKLYMVKVIVEKLYLVQKKIISLNDIEQKRDSIEMWYDILERI